MPEFALVIEVTKPCGSVVHPRRRTDRCPALARDLSAHPATDPRSSAPAYPAGSEVFRQPGVWFVRGLARRQHRKFIRNTRALDRFHADHVDEPPEGTCRRRHDFAANVDVFSISAISVRMVAVYYGTSRRKNNPFFRFIPPYPGLSDSILKIVDRPGGCL
jgi:hypothetical protein